LQTMEEGKWEKRPTVVLRRIRALKEVGSLLRALEIKEDLLFVRTGLLNGFEQIVGEGYQRYAHKPEKKKEKAETCGGGKDIEPSLRHTGRRKD